MTTAVLEPCVIHNPVDTGIEGTRVAIFGREKGNFKTYQKDEAKRPTAFNLIGATATDLGIDRVYLPFCQPHNGVIAEPGAPWKRDPNHSHLLYGVEADAVIVPLKKNIPGSTRITNAVMFPTGGCPILAIRDGENAIVYVVHCSRINLAPEKGPSVIYSVIDHLIKNFGKKKVSSLQCFMTGGIRTGFHLDPRHHAYGQKNLAYSERIERRWGHNIYGPDTNWILYLDRLIEAQLKRRGISNFKKDSLDARTDPRLRNHSNGDKERDGVFVIVE